MGTDRKDVVQNSNKKLKRLWILYTLCSLSRFMSFMPRRSLLAKQNKNKDQKKKNPLFTTSCISEDLEQVSVLQPLHLGADCGKVSYFLFSLQHHCIYSPVISLPTLILRKHLANFRLRHHCVSRGFCGIGVELLRCCCMGILKHL